MGTTRKIPGPGPAAYEVKHFGEEDYSGMINTTACSFGARVDSAHAKEGTKKALRNKVGPGAYHLKEEMVTRRAPSFGFGGGAKRLLSDRPKSQQETTPGPLLSHGDNPRQKAAPSHGFGKTEKFFRSPGHYENVGGRGMRHPAPGEYDPKEEATSRVMTAPAVSATPRREPFAAEDFAFPAPGPGAYKIEDCTNQMKRGATYRFGTSPRQAAPPKSLKSPGPGQYVVVGTDNNKMASAPKFSMRARGDMDQAKYL